MTLGLTLLLVSLAASILGLALSWIGLAQARRQSTRAGLSLAGIIIGGFDLAGVAAIAAILVYSGFIDTGSSDGDPSLTAISFCNASRGWVVGEAGTILATTDGGVTWSAQRSGSSAGINGITFSNASHGWAVGDSGTILATSDGGRTWMAQQSGTTVDLWDVAFGDSKHGWAVGSDGRQIEGTILATKDGGRTWIAQPSGTTQDLHAVAVSDNTHGWVVGEQCQIFATANGGHTWKLPWEAPTSTWNTDLQDVAFIDAMHGWAVGWAPWTTTVRRPPSSSPPTEEPLGASRARAVLRASRRSTSSAPLTVGLSATAGPSSPPRTAGPVGATVIRGRREPLPGRHHRRCPCLHIGLRP